MDAPRAARAGGAEPHGERRPHLAVRLGRERRGLAQEAPGEQRRLDEERGVGAHRLAAEQLRRQQRPLRILVRAVRVQAGGARRPAGHHDGADAHAIAGELDRHVGDVSAHQAGGPPRIEQPVRDDDERDAGLRHTAVPP
ncbi:hypothetical protein CXR34_07565 [Microbacterium hominis]|uniref:Uncharacterized protein n=1 Tax=Microbacterium hominis TaxID=162426 RepID=A0A2K9DEH9_9MICO|nr:hypothetical protein CXR34_07565 [Microbacterium hominis]